LTSRSSRKLLRITEMCNFDLNPKIEAGAFVLPK
jgi:hypothetical protein